MLVIEIKIIIINQKKNLRKLVRICSKVTHNRKKSYATFKTWPNIIKLHL